jgi:bacterioferritin
MALDKQALIDGLNSDLAGEYAAIIQYTHYAATVTGPFRESLRTMFMAEVPDEQRHAQYLADQIAFLGGTPTTAPRPVPAAGTPKEMLRRILEAEERAVKDYNERIRQAEEYGDTGLKPTPGNKLPIRGGAYAARSCSSIGATHDAAAVAPTPSLPA